MASKPKIIIGLITYGETSAKYLDEWYGSVIAQSGGDYKILVADNSDEEANPNRKFFAEHPEAVFFWNGGNLGFARAYNILINRARVMGAEYLLAVNPDLVLAPEFLAEAVKVLEADERIGAVAPLIYRWDHAGGRRTDAIDSTGLRITRDARFFDRDQGGQAVPPAGSVFGFTGAAVLFRLKALEDTAYPGGVVPEFFDENMFMYKEDVDLSIRLRLADWKILFVPRAVCWHDRTAAGADDGNLRTAFNRMRKSQRLKIWSYLNHLIILAKYRHLAWPWWFRVFAAWYQFKCAAFAVFFEPYLLGQFARLKELRPEIEKRRAALKVKVEPRDLLKFL